MVGGRLRCLGSIQHLKSRFGRGFLADVKLSDPSPATVAEIEAAVAAELVRLGAPGGGGALPRGAVRRVCEALGNAPRSAQVTETGTGWAIAASFARSAARPEPTIPTAEFAAWWAGEDAALRLRNFFVVEAFPGSELVERHGSHLRFQLPPQGDRALAGLFTAVEGARERLGVASYALGQTSLENIFLAFAGAQAEETGHIRGMTGGQTQAAGAHAAPGTGGEVLAAPPPVV